MITFFYKTTIGNISITETRGTITNLCFQEELMPRHNAILETDILSEAARQLQDYLAGKLRDFDLPLDPAGTDFMLRVWKNLITIPYGDTQSYGEVAQGAGNNKAARAVGLACNRNPIPIFIPCHRVIGADGSLTGYRGGLDIKSHLLSLEKMQANQTP